MADSDLDLDTLKRKLWESDAVGFFGKMSLKGEIDSLVDDFAEFHQGRDDGSLSHLSARFAALYQRTLGLLEDDDPDLYRELLVSRTVIWGMLSDPGRFKQFAPVGFDRGRAER